MIKGGKYWSHARLTDSELLEGGNKKHERDIPILEPTSRVNPETEVMFWANPGHLESGSTSHACGPTQNICLDISHNLQSLKSTRLNITFNASWYLAYKYAVLARWNTRPSYVKRSPRIN